MEQLLRVWVPLLPPTSNNIYVRHPAGRGRVLSAKARHFKIRAMQAVQSHGRVVLLQVKRNVPYKLHLAIFFEQVENKASRKGDRYKKMDLSNRIKLIEDTIAEAVGLDDSHNFISTQEKHCDPNNPGLYVTLSRVPEEEVGLTKEAYDLRLQATEHHRAGGTSPTARLLVRPSRTGKANTHRRDPGRGRSPRLPS